MIPTVYSKVLKFVLPIVAIALWVSTPAWGFRMISKDAGGEVSNVPVHVTAERMEVDHATNLIRFSGNVVSVRGAMVIRSDVLDVFNTGNEGDEDQIEKIVAQGNVQFENETKRATGDKAVYLAKNRTVVLQGNPKAWDGENEVSGSRITMYLDEDKSVVEGDAGRRVEVSIDSKKGQESDFPSLGKGNAKEGAEEASPILVTADRMESDHQQKVVFFEGKVKTKRADFGMDSDELEVFDSGQQNSRVSKIIARGNVRIDRAGKVATGDKAIYYEKDRKFLLTGHAKAWEDQNVVTGSRMEIYIDEDKSVVLGDAKEQVEVTIYPSEAPSSKQPLPPPSLSTDAKLID
jgi:lipopolysaccharide export system protein LptA